MGLHCIMPRLSFITGGKKTKPLLRTGTLRKPRRLQSQDYQTLLEKSLGGKQLFVDETFPASLASIGSGCLLGKLPDCVEWKRPHNCWFLAALSSLTFHPDILTNVVPQNQSFEKNYSGIFHFRFWRFGEWVDVVVDDRLPVNNKGKLLFVSSGRKNLFWGPLLEKAYAKLCGSYEDMQIGQVSEALVDFTGGVNMSIKMAQAPPDLFQIMMRAQNSGSLMGCQTQTGPERVLDNGLVTGHAYSVMDVRQVTCKSETENLVRLRNPWGKIEWKGKWSDRCPKWDQLSYKERLFLRKKRENGEFWMSIEDFETHFVELVICKLTPDLMSHEIGKEWTLSMQCGKWSAGSTAGGRMTYMESYWMNPQYRLKIFKGDDMEKFTNSCNVLVSLLQKQNHKHRNQCPPLYIGMSVFVYQGVRRLPQKFFRTQRPINNKCVFINEREVTQDYHLMPGSYVIVPSTAEPNQECEFILRVFSRKHLLRILPYCFNLDLLSPSCSALPILSFCCCLPLKSPPCPTVIFLSVSAFSNCLHLTLLLLSYTSSLFPSHPIVTIYSSSLILSISPYCYHFIYLFLLSPSVASFPSSLSVSILPIQEQTESPNIVLCCKKIAERHRNGAWENNINKYFAKHPEIKVTQLQQLLNKVTWTNVKQAPGKFSLDDCKLIMALLDVSFLIL
ncbi:hypothetical protein XELAEV_18026312mg [Xenopus laevis]|uniref:Calpain catalytic domain-containing protein n=1 Tax=Xenopus laevis TaxID=8355 RepID=A0A974HIN2_XENLA|nr:hypothetical protein XELAEV_18026312mg [Xenopus laevis]